VGGAVAYDNLAFVGSLHSQSTLHVDIELLSYLYFATEYLPGGEGQGHRRPWLLRSNTRLLRVALYPHDTASSNEWLQHYLPLVGTCSWEQKS
jgi:hypothetical protein